MPALPLSTLPSHSAIAEISEWLKQVPLFADVDLESLSVFAPVMFAREYAAREVLFRQGDTSDDVYLVTRGETLIRIEQDGREVATDKVIAGSCVGEMAALTGKPRSATVLAGSQGASVLIVPGPRFRDLLLLQPLLGVNMLAMMSERLRQTELRKQHAALARRADELGKSKDAADTAARVKADLLASMSHELRTPLNGIIGLTEMVLETSLTHSQREYLNLVRESGESLLGLINDVLDMSKLEAGRLELDIEPFELRDRLIETLKTMAVRAHHKKVELACRVGPEVPDRLLGDFARFRQIIVNLVGNAIKFTERGEIVVEVTCPQRTATAVTLQVTVRDTGIGIPKEKLAQLFKPYAQADASIAQRFGGTGLGLSISAKLIEGMRGRIWVDSEVGAGSAFHFALELGVDPQENHQVGSDEKIALAGKRALLVGSHPISSRILQETLQEWGLVVETAGTGAEAATRVDKAIAKSSPFAFLLMDARISDSLEWMRKIPNGKILKTVILLTTNQVNEGTRCDEADISHLFMPLKPSELLKALAGSRSPSLSHTSPSPEEAAQKNASQFVAPPSTSGARILLAEDGLVNQKVALALLAKKGHQVTLATTGKAVLAVLEGQPFDLVLMDVHMPEMDGLEATRAIRAREQQTGSHLPVIAMTASDSPKDIQRCLTTGMDALVSKPVRQEHLFATLEEFLAVPSGAGAKKSAAVDWPTALRQVDGRHEILEERASLLLQEFPRVQRGLFTAAAEWNPTFLRIAAHTLKVALGTFGAQPLANMSQQLEEAAGRNDQDGANKLLAEFRPESERLLATLQRFCGGTAL